jgi:DGQHR domain-containing protein
LIREDALKVKFPVIRVRQPIGDFYVGAMNAKDLIDITYFDIRRLVHEDGIDTYLGIQRQLNKKRVEELKSYVNATDATFPTAVILAVQEQSVNLTAVKEGEQFFWMELMNSPGNDDDENTVLYRQIARVIDGQHRIVGLEGFSGESFQVNIAIFVGADISDQANIFATVNLAQTKVNRSLVYDLFELSKARSPEKTCHNIAVALDRTEGSPFYHRIKRLGTATEGRFGETLRKPLSYKVSCNIFLRTNFKY